MSGYPTRPFREVCGLQKGKKPHLHKERQNDSLPYLTARYMRGTEAPQWVEPSDKNAIKVQAHELIIICDGSNSGETFHGVEGVLSSTMAKVSHGAEIDTTFLRYFLISQLEKYAETKTGAAIPHLDLKGLKEEKVPVPTLPEQRRIVGILDQAFEGITNAKANAERNLANAKELFEGFLTSVFSQADADSVMRRMSDVCDRVTVGHVGSMASRYKEDGIPFLRSQNIRPFDIDLNNVVFIDEGFHASLKKSRLKSGDVAIVRTGYPGTAAVIPDDLGEANCSDIVIMTPNELADPYYLTAFFNSSYGKSVVSGEAVGAAQKHFNVTSAKNVVLPFPSIEKQRHVCAEIKAFKEMVETASDIYERKADAIDRLKASILHQAFSGNL